MKESVKKIEFRNATNPKMDFDMVSISELKNRAFIDHSPFELHQVNFFAILCFTSGQGIHSVDFKDYQCEKGSLIILRKDQLHKFADDTLDGQLILFTFEFLGSYFEENEAFKSLLIFNEFLASPKLKLKNHQYREIDQIINRLHQEYIEVNDSLSPGIIRSELQILISKIFRIKAHINSFNHDKKYLKEFIRLNQLVEDKYKDTLKVMDYARMIGVSTKTLNSITRSIVNKNAKEFIDEICLNHIKRKLIRSKLSIKEIAYGSGFNETSNFYNYFKKRIGQTPEEYRNSNS